MKVGDWRRDEEDDDNACIDPELLEVPHVVGAGEPEAETVVEPVAARARAHEVRELNWEYLWSGVLRTLGRRS